MPKLSEHFTLEELTATKHVALQQQNRELAKDYEFTLSILANYVLEPVRAILGVPIIITCGFRCESLNEVVDGSPTSQHLNGEAADFVPQGISVQEAFEKLKAAPGLQYGQLILYAGWLHISLGAPFRALGKNQQNFKK